MTRPARGVKVVMPTPASRQTARQRARALLAIALAESMKEVGASQSAAGRWTGVDARTIRSWLHGERPINVERVLASPKLGAAFVEYLRGKEPAIDVDDQAPKAKHDWLKELRVGEQTASAARWEKVNE